MTRREYELIAAGLAAAYSRAEGLDQRMGVAMAIDEVRNRLGADNPRFDRMRFTDAAMAPSAPAIGPDGRPL